MSMAWENNPNGICEDAPCCGCCGPQGDGRYDPDEPPYDDELNYDPEEWEDEDPEDYDIDYPGQHGESPDPNWMNP